MIYNNQDLRILNITHSDMDGIASAIVLKNFYKKVITIPVTYQSEKLITEALAKYNGQFDAVICTDFYPSNSIDQIREATQQYLVLDHHESVEQFNDNKNIIINTSMCGAKLTYNFINHFKDISYLKELIDIVNDWDMFILKDIRSRYFNNMFWEMGNKWFMRRFMTGNVKLYPEEKQYLIDAQAEFKDMYDNLEISDLVDNGVYFETDRFMNETVEALKKDGYKWFAIRNKNSISVRADDVNLLDVFKIFNNGGYTGGGHPHAGGIPLSYKSDVGKVLNDLQNAYDAVYTNN